MSNKKTMAWGWIIVWCILFWPVGVILLFKKISNDKSATINNSKTVFTISYVLIGMGILLLIMGITGDWKNAEGTSTLASNVVLLALLLGGGVWMNIIAMKMKKNAAKYKKYIDLVVNQNLTDIENIAPAVGVECEMVIDDLQKMINAGYFANAHIDDGKKEIVLMHSDFSVSAQPVATQTKVATCASCGANNEIPVGRVVECEYCGSPIK